MSANVEQASCYQKLFNHMSEEHGLTLLESEMDEIIQHSLNVVKQLNNLAEYINDANKFKKGDIIVQSFSDEKFLIESVKAVIYEGNTAIFYDIQNIKTKTRRKRVELQENYFLTKI
jgi:predicted small metal-binding protein